MNGNPDTTLEGQTTANGSGRDTKASTDPVEVPPSDPEDQPQGHEERSDYATRRLGAIGILTAVAAASLYFLIPVIFLYPEYYQRYQSLLLAISAMILGSLASAYYLRTGHLPSALGRILTPGVSSETSRKRREANTLHAGRLSQQDRAWVNGLIKEAVSRANAAPAAARPNVKGALELPVAESIDVASSHYLEAAMLSASKRLQREIPELGRRANLNLVFGVFFALGGMIALWWAAVNVAASFDPAKDWRPVLLASIPRVSLAIVVELFSYFFLGLYRTSIGEIMHFQNEITTTEIRLLALRTATESTDADTLRSVVLECAKTDRNQRLRKGETTVELERERMNSSILENTLERIGDLLKRVSK